MSNNTLDSDLYGDIYGDEDNEYDQLPPDPELADHVMVDGNTETIEVPPPKPDVPTPSPVVTQDAFLSLPAKPSVSSDATSLSYSAQVAKQFSAYQQTPSQERQQRREISLPQNPRTNPARPTFPSVSSGGTDDTVFGKKPSEMHDAGKMFIGGLNWDTTDEGLRDYFSQFGKVVVIQFARTPVPQSLIFEKVDACTIMRDPSGTSRGFAFMTFEDPNAVDLVVNRDHHLDGKAIDPKRAIPRDEHLRNTRYFVGGLAPNTTPESMRQFFGDYGKVVDATVMLDRDSGRSKGFGFVTFEDASNADQLVGKSGLILDEKQIEVKAAQPRNQRDQQARTPGPQTTTSTFESFDQRLPTVPTTMSFAPVSQQNPMSLLYQRSMSQLPLGMMGMNPMMGMMMNNFGMGNNPPMNMMSSGLEGMMNIGNMAGMGPMRLGVGPVGNLGMRPVVIGSGHPAGMAMRTLNNSSNFTRSVGNPGVGPARATTRGQHGYHPYAR